MRINDTTLDDIRYSASISHYVELDSEIAMGLVDDLREAWSVIEKIKKELYNGSPDVDWRVMQVRQLIEEYENDLRPCSQ